MLRRTRPKATLAALASGFALACASVCPIVPEAEKRDFLATRPEEGGYIIQAGDRLQVEVWKNQQMTREVVVRPDGKITLPLVNDVEAAGDTVPKFQQRLKKQLEAFIKDPVVSITVTGFTSSQIYVQGEIARPSAYGYTGRLFLLQALTLAGGPTPFARGCAVIVRRKGDAFVRYNLELEPISSGTNLAENLELQPNDVVSVR